VVGFSSDGFCLDVFGLCLAVRERFEKCPNEKKLFVLHPKQGVHSHCQNWSLVSQPIFQFFEANKNFCSTFFAEAYFDRFVFHKFVSLTDSEI